MLLRDVLLAERTAPRRESRANVIELLKPERIGAHLTEIPMLVPEPSTDALVVHHPQAKYFDV
jgi:5-methyltetrahydrofolate--homocysteine methyltransferase